MSPPSLHLLPVRTGAAAENMALDFLLLQRYPEPAAPRFRHYEWREPAFTFGYSQKMEFVRAQLPANETFDLCRRPTGGGIVDHRNDWTYTLVLPRGHALYDAPAPQSYRAVHEALAEALRSLGQPAAAKAAADPAEEGAAGVCFQRAELYDVVNPGPAAKIAGAAMKRNKHGLLLQGSVEKNRVNPLDWEEFERRFTAALGRAVGAEPAATHWPELNEAEVEGLIAQYSSAEWVGSR